MVGWSLRSHSKEWGRNTVCFDLRVWLRDYVWLSIGEQILEVGPEARTEVLRLPGDRSQREEN